MSTYVKTTVMIAIMAMVVMFVAFKFSVEVSNDSVQKSLDAQADEASKLIALGLNDLNFDSTDMDTIEYIVNGSFALGGFESISLVDANGNMRIQKKKEIKESSYTDSLVSLKAKEFAAEIKDNGGVSGKIIVKSDIGTAYKTLSDKVSKLMQIFLAMGLASIIILAIMIRFFGRNDNK